jgi:hypothetical protein
LNFCLQITVVEREMRTTEAGRPGDFVQRLVADYKLACFARALLETRSVSAAVGSEA